VGGINFSALHDFHKENNALATVMLVEPRKEKDYGAVFLGNDQKIDRFNEKADEDKKHYMNAGVYCMRKDAFSHMPDGAFSLETDFFPSLVSDKKDFYGFPVDGVLIDIGTPERYKLAQKTLLS